MDQDPLVSEIGLEHSPSVALRQFSIGLWRIFLGLVMICIGVVLPFLVLATKIQIDPKFLWVSVGLTIVGAWVHLSGKQHCWSFALPVQKRHYLTLSFAFDIAAFACRMARNLDGIGPIAKPLVSLFALLSLCFLIGFIGYLAKVIDAKSAKLMVWGTWVSMSFAMVTAFLWGFFSGLGRPEWTFAPMVLAIISAGLSMVMLMALTANMSIQLKQLSDFLERESE
ncbi:MAG: hypothetical protein JNL67_07365 [Planctomycetaceae bacterium]|nr:hypothetical protein [Planctomycetaceae bacterium]